MPEGFPRGGTSVGTGNRSIPKRRYRCAHVGQGYVGWIDERLGQQPKVLLHDEHSKRLSLYCASNVRVVTPAVAWAIAGPCRWITHFRPFMEQRSSASPNFISRRNARFLRRATDLFGLVIPPLSSVRGIQLLRPPDLGAEVIRH